MPGHDLNLLDPGGVVPGAGARIEDLSGDPQTALAPDGGPGQLS